MLGEAEGHVQAREWAECHRKWRSVSFLTPSSEAFRMSKRGFFEVFGVIAIVNLMWEHVDLQMQANHGNKPLLISFTLWYTFSCCVATEEVFVSWCLSLRFFLYVIFNSQSQEIQQSSREPTTKMHEKLEKQNNRTVCLHLLGLSLSVFKRLKKVILFSGWRLFFRHSMPLFSNKLAIRFAKYGCTNRPFYHLVVIKANKGRNKPPLEQLGSFDPLTNVHGEKLVAFNYERIRYWIGKGAEPTKPVLKLLGTLSEWYWKKVLVKQGLRMGLSRPKIKNEFSHVLLDSLFGIPQCSHRVLLKSTKKHMCFLKALCASTGECQTASPIVRERTHF